MKKIILMSMFLALSAQANIPLVPHCPREFFEEAKKLGAKESWTEQAPSPEGYHVSRTPTHNMGQWLEVAYDKNNTVLYSMTNAATTKMTFGKDCKMKQAKETGFNARNQYPDSKALWLDDSELQKIMAKYPEGLIYVWSPGMTYSVQFYKRFEEVAKEMNLKFIPVMDHRASFAEAAAMGKKYPIPASKLKLNSVELYMRNVTTHFPGSLVFKNGQLNQNRIIGVMEKPELHSVIKKELETL